MKLRNKQQVNELVQVTNHVQRACTSYKSCDKCIETLARMIPLAAWVV